MHIPSEPLSPVLWRADQSGFQAAKARLRQADTLDDDTASDANGVLYCAQCRAPISHDSDRVSRRGSHQHRCRNPNDLVFHIGCFADAGGCVSSGPSGDAWTWFPGYYWQVSWCSACGAHLGWCYRGNGDVFYGLILDRLVTGRSGAD